MNVKTKNYIFYTLALSLLFTLSSCKKEKNVVVNTDSIQLSIQPALQEEIKDLSTTQNQQWHITNKRIYVLLGYNYNSPEIISDYTQLLQNRYGLDSDGGLIELLTYPDSFKHGGKAYVSELTSFLTENEKEIAGVIALGAPENTHIALARVQDYWNMDLPFPIFAIFPQDEVLGLESTCDFVLEKAQKAEVTNDITLEETESEENSLAPEIMTDCIDYMLAVASSLEKNLTLQKHAEQMLKNKRIQHYVDPETGIQSINHFVLLEK